MVNVFCSYKIAIKWISTAHMWNMVEIFTHKYSYDNGDRKW